MNEAIAYGRIGLLGNPSDMYGGKCISFTFENYSKVSVSDFPEIKIEGNSSSDDHLTYNGSNDLVKATIKYLGLGDKRMRIHYKTNIPIGAGLSGSSAIIIATIRAFNKRFKLGLNAYEIAEAALHVETDELKIAAGFQDRYIISFGGVCFMDFSGKEYMRDPKIEGYGKVEKLNIKDIPCFLCLGAEPKSSAAIHNPLREKFLNGSMDEKKEIKNDMDEMAELAVLGKEVLLKKDWKGLGNLMNKNTELRENLKRHLGKNTMHLEKDMEMINKAISYGALGAKVAGSGGAIIVLSEDKKVLDKMIKEYPCLIPKISYNEK